MPTLFTHIKLRPWTGPEDRVLCCIGRSSFSMEIADTPASLPDLQREPRQYPICPTCVSMLDALGRASWHLCEKCGRPYICESSICGNVQIGERAGRCYDCDLVLCETKPCGDRASHLVFNRSTPGGRLTYRCSKDAGAIMEQFSDALVYLIPLKPVEAAPASRTIHLKIRTGELNSVVDADTACGKKDMQFLFHALNKPEELKAFLGRMTPPAYTGNRVVCPACVEAVGKRSTGFLEQGFVCINCEALECQFCFNTACTCCAGKGRGRTLSGV